MTGLNPKLKQPIAWNWNLTLQRELFWNSTLSVAYVAHRGYHGWDVYDINQAPAGTTLANPGVNINALRPYQGFAAIQEEESVVNSMYSGLQVTWNRRFTAGSMFQFSYTFSKSMDNSSNYRDIVPDTYNTTNLWAPSEYDARHMIVINYLWDIPKASKLWNSPVSRWVFDNWQVSGITSFISGAPCPFGISGTTQCGTNVPSSSFTTVDGADIAGGGDGVRVVLTGNPNLSSSQRSFNQWFDTGVVHRPAQGTFGNSPFAPIVGPGISNWNMALFKNVPIKERYVFQLRVETYNTFNHTQFSAINTTPRFDAAGNQVNPSFGQVSATANPRYMQFAARFSF